MTTIEFLEMHLSIYLMKNKLLVQEILFFLFFSVNTCFSQDIYICDTSNVIFRTDSVVKYKSNYFFNFFKNSIDSVVTINFKTKIKEDVIIETSYKDNELNGPIRYYTEDSTLFMQGFFKNGKADSMFIGYQIYIFNYKKEAIIANFKNGLKNGEEFEFNDKGKIIFIRNYKDGLLEGLYKQIDEYGNILTEGKYKKGKKNEAWNETYPSERIAVYQNYKNDKLKDYIWASFYENGKLFVKGTYNKYGEKNGVFYIYEQDGTLKNSEKYKNGKRTGNYIEYFDGKAVRKTRYRNDKIVKK